LFSQFFGAFEAHRQPGGHHGSRVAIGQAMPWSAHRNAARRYHSGEEGSLIVDAVGSWKNGKFQGEELENKEVKQREWWLVG